MIDIDLLIPLEEGMEIFALKVVQNDVEFPRLFLLAKSPDEVLVLDDSFMLKILGDPELGQKIQHEFVC